MSHQEKLLEFYHARRRMPSYRELMPLFGYRTKSAVAYALEKIIDTGLIAKDRQGKIVPGRMWGSIRLLGLVEAGFPSPAEEDGGDMMSLDEYLIPRRDASYMLCVKGDSMKDAGIVEGDMVIVERTQDAKVGNIVIAEVDGAFTMKYLRKKDGRLYLEAANPKYTDIHPKEGLKIEAVVRSVVRKY